MTAHVDLATQDTDGAVELSSGHRPFQLIVKRIRARLIVAKLDLFGCECECADTPSSLLHVVEAFGSTRVFNLFRGRTLAAPYYSSYQQA